jgi:hypothetical protein
MEGTFAVRATFVKASFPQGPRGLSNPADANIAGYRMGSCITLPNVGDSPKAPYMQRFAATAGKVFADHAYNTPRRLEAFWPSAQLEAVRNYPFASGAVASGVPCYVSGNGCTVEDNPGLHAPSGRFGLTYGGQTNRRNTFLQQTVDATVVAVTSTTRESAAAADADASVPFYAAQTYVQYNVEQGQQVAYTELLQLDPPPKGSAVVKGKLRVAAFLSGPPAGADTGASGDASSSSAPDRRVAVALYDYDLVLEPAAEEQ